MATHEELADAFARALAAGQALGASPALSPNPWWRRVDGVGAVLGAAISVVTLGTLALTALGLDKRLDSLETELHRLDDRLTPAISNLATQVAALDKREAVDTKPTNGTAGPSP